MARRPSLLSWAFTSLVLVTSFARAAETTKEASSSPASSTSSPASSSPSAPPPKLAPLSLVPDKNYFVGADFKVVPPPGLHALSPKEARSENEREILAKGGAVFIASHPSARAEDDERRFVVVPYPGGLPFVPAVDTCAEFWRGAPELELLDVTLFALPGVPACRGKLKSNGATTAVYIIGGPRRGWQIQCDGLEKSGVELSCDVLAKSFVSLGVGRLRGNGFEVPIPMGYRGAVPGGKLARLKESGGVLLASAASDATVASYIFVEPSEIDASISVGTKAGCQETGQGLLGNLPETYSGKVELFHYEDGEGCRGVLKDSGEGHRLTFALLRPLPQKGPRHRFYLVNCFQVRGDERAMEACSEVLEGFELFGSQEP